MSFVDLVIVNVDGEKILCVAPDFSYLKEGDFVMINEHLMVNVVKSDTFPKDETNKGVEMILTAFGVDHIDELPKIKAKVSIHDFEY